MTLVSLSVSVWFTMFPTLKRVVKMSQGKSVCDDGQNARFEARFLAGRELEVCVIFNPHPPPPKKKKKRKREIKERKKKKSEPMQKYLGKSCFFIMSSLYLIFFNSFDLIFKENKI